NPPATPPGPIVAPPMPPPPAFAVPRKAPLATLPPVPEPKTASAREELAAVSDEERAGAAKPSGKQRPESARRKQGEPPEPGPKDTSLETPELAALPDPETVRPPPPAPTLPPVALPSALAPIEPPPEVAAAG